MTKELTYQVRFKVDPTGATAAANALDNLQKKAQTTRQQFASFSTTSTAATSAFDALSTRSSYVAQAFQGMQMAAQGNVSAIFGVARALKALVESLSSGIGSFTIIITLVMLAAKAFMYFKEKQVKAMEDSTKALNDYVSKIRPLVDRLKDLKDKSSEVTYSIKNQQEQVKSIAEYYDNASASAKRYAETQKKVADAKTEMDTANVSLKRAWGLMGAKSPEEKAKVELQAEVDQAEVDHAAKEASLAIEKAMTEKEIGIRTTEVNALTNALAPAPAIAEAESNLNDLKAKLESIQSISRGKMTAMDFAAEAKTTEQIVAQEKALVALKESEAERISSTKKLIATQQESLAVLDEERKIQLQTQEVIDQQYDAKKKLLEYQEKINKVEAENLALKRMQQDVEEDIAMTKAEEEATIEGLKQDVEALNKAYLHQYKIATDPEYRKTAKKAAKDKAKEEEDWQKQVARAQMKQARGVRGTWITETLQANMTGKGAAQAKKALEQAEAQMAMNIQKSATYLEIIKEKLDQNLQLK